MAPRALSADTARGGRGFSSAVATAVVHGRNDTS